MMRAILVILSCRGLLMLHFCSIFYRTIFMSSIQAHYRPDQDDMLILLSCKASLALQY